MKKVFLLMLVLFLFYFGIQIIFNFFGSGHNINYNIDGFDVNEILVQNAKNENDNYYFEILKDDNKFGFKIEKGGLGSKIIKEIKYIKNSNYECIAPVIRKSEYTTVLCKKDEIYYDFATIRGNDPEIDKFAIEYSNLYFNTENVLKTNGNLTVYDNLVSDSYIALEYYKGIYILNNKNGYKKVALFKYEKYNKEISTIINNYYLTADYDKEYDFHKFYLVDLETGKKKTIISNTAISFNSYIQGVVNNYVYLIDRDNKRQFKIDIKNDKVNLIGDENSGALNYINNEFVKIGIYEMVQNKVQFNSYTVDSIFNGKKYDKVDLVGTEYSGYYYLYEKVGNIYKVYGAFAKNMNQITYLFETTNIENIRYYRNNVFYTDGAYIYAYNNFGNRLICKYDDLMYNSYLKFYVY